MNLHSIVGPIVAAVNPWITGSLQRSNGYTTDDDGAQQPAYIAAVDIEIQMQALSFKDLHQLSGLNINGESRAMYLYGNVLGVLRPDRKGGDLITLPDASIWLVVHVLENWNTTAGWTKVAVVRQSAAS